jgi:hypothetical protein
MHDIEHHEDRTPTHGYEATREAAMAVFAKSYSPFGAPEPAAPAQLARVLDESMR